MVLPVFTAYYTHFSTKKPESAEYLVPLPLRTIDTSALSGLFLSREEISSGVQTLSSLRFKTISAKNWSITSWLERNSVLFSTICTSDFKRLTFSATSSVISHALLFRRSTLWASNWSVLEAFLGVKLLFRCSPGKRFPAVSTC